MTDRDLLNAMTFEEINELEEKMKDELEEMQNTRKSFGGKPTIEEKRLRCKIQEIDDIATPKYLESEQFTSLIRSTKPSRRKVAKEKEIKQTASPVIKAQVYSESEELVRLIKKRDELTMDRKGVDSSTGKQKWEPVGEEEGQLRKEIERIKSRLRRKQKQVGVLEVMKRKDDEISQLRKTGEELHRRGEELLKREATVEKRERRIKKKEKRHDKLQAIIKEKDDEIAKLKKLLENSR